MLARGDVQPDLPGSRVSPAGTRSLQAISSGKEKSEAFHKP